MTFFLLLSWLGATYWATQGPAAAVHGVIFILLLFGCVVLHELGHALAARRYGIRTNDITLLPIGGIASLDRIPEEPAREIFVALAGPVVNVVIAFVLVLLLGAKIDFAGLQSMSSTSAVDMASRLATVNIVLAIFNLVPAFPMDGGRVFRALLAFWFGFPSATRIAARVGQSIAFGFALLGLLGNPVLILIALFIFFAAAGETNAMDLREASRGRRAADAMITSFESLGLDSTIDDAANLILRTTQQEFPVVDGKRQFHGVITREAIVAALAQAGGGSPVVDAMATDLPVELLNAPLETVVRHLEKEGTVAVALTDAQSRFVGYVSAENIAELLMIRRASDVSRAPKLAWG
jgi:stage IV sporulation protein FB